MHTHHPSMKRLKQLLLVLCAAQLMVILDISAVNLALPDMASDLGIGGAGLFALPLLSACNDDPIDPTLRATIDLRNDSGALNGSGSSSPSPSRRSSIRPIARVA